MKRYNNLNGVSQNYAQISFDDFNKFFSRKGIVVTVSSGCGLV